MTRIVNVPGDGNCLFHAVAYSTRISHTLLRQKCADFIRDINVEKTNDDEPTLVDWIRYETGMDTEKYADYIQSTGRWGGAIELMCMMQLLNMSIGVYMHHHGELKNIVTFTPSGGGLRSIRIYYNGHSHFAALE